jgi:hypothetical protein
MSERKSSFRLAVEAHTVGNFGIARDLKTPHADLPLGISVGICFGGHAALVDPEFVRTMLVEAFGQERFDEAETQTYLVVEALKAVRALDDAGTA